MVKDQSRYACYVFERQWISNLIKNAAVQISIQLELHEGWFLALHLFRDYCCVAKFASPPGVRCNHSWIGQSGTGVWLGSPRLARHFLCFVEIIPARNKSTCKMLGQHSQERCTRLLTLPAPNPQVGSTQCYSENLAGTQNPFACGDLLQVHTSLRHGTDDM